jgi:hypothetical protein
MARLKDRNAPVRVLDIAAGHGRYVLEALAGSAVTPDTILLRDYSDINVAAGRRLERIPLISNHSLSVGESWRNQPR